MDRFSVSLRGLAAAAVVCAFACLTAASASAAPLGWSLNPTKNTVTAFDPSTNQVVGSPIQTGGGPNSIAITPNGKRAYVANSTGQSVTVIETGTRIPIATIELPGPGEGVAIASDGATAYVTTGSDQKVVAIDTATNTIVGSVPLAGATSALAAAAIGPSGPGNEFIYVGVGTEAVQGVDPRRGSLVNPAIEVGGTAKAIGFSPDGKTTYVAAGEEVTVIGKSAIGIPIGAVASGLAVSPDGARVYVTSAAAGSLTTIDTASGAVVGKPVEVPGEPEEIVLTASGKTAYVANASSERLTPINLVTGKVGTPLFLPGSGGKLAISPDQPPVAAFNPPEALAGVPVTFSAAPSTDPDSSIATYQWFTGDSASARGISFTHTFLNPGTYSTVLSLTDDEGCGGSLVFTGRTAYCNGSGVASVTQPVMVETVPVVCSARFAIRGVSHNRRNGTVRLRLRFTSTGSFLLFGRKIHAVTRKVRRPGSAVVTLHARVELNKRLKKTLRARVRYRVTFTPSAGCGSKTVHRSVALQRAPRPKHHR
jgi:YVTN family beta-propeller protein